MDRVSEYECFGGEFEVSDYWRYRSEKGLNRHRLGRTEVKEERD